MEILFPLPSLNFAMPLEIKDNLHYSTTEVEKDCNKGRERCYKKATDIAFQKHKISKRINF